MELDKKFWDSKYTSKDTAWDAREITRPLKEYIDQLPDKNITILIPGCGFGYEAQYLYEKGFKNVYVSDLSLIPLDDLQKRCPSIPADRFLNEDFFAISRQFDLILEQTFFCAIDPSLRKKYAEKVASLLKKGAKLVGVLFDDHLNTDKPPFGGTKEEYISYFRPYFDFKYFERCYNSIPRRAGRELFINLVKKVNG